MPAHIFEFLYTYYHLKNVLGKPPSNVLVAKTLGIDFCTGLQRKNTAIALGYIVDPGHLPRDKDWAILTDRGAEAFMAVLDGIEDVYIKEGTKCSLNRDFLPNHINYVGLPMKQYMEYLKALKQHGHATPTESRS